MLRWHTLDPSRRHRCRDPEGAGSEWQQVALPVPLSRGARLDHRYDGLILSLETFIAWGHQLRASWETENFAPLGDRSSGDSTVLAAAITQMFSSMATMQRTLQKLGAMQESNPAKNTSPSVCSCTTIRSDVVVDAPSLSDCFYNWYTLELWLTTSQKKQHFIRADLKASVNIMIISAGSDIDVPTAPLHHDGVAYQPWKRELWTLAEDLDVKTNECLATWTERINQNRQGPWGSAGENCVRNIAYDSLC
jgi:hypothetical protein